VLERIICECQSFGLVLESWENKLGENENQGRNNESTKEDCSEMAKSIIETCVRKFE